ncbi:50S ribosomal protein L29 [Rhabdochlamydiaceae symbiont of Dictyostelium giganteum]|uniref:50S ribosomal protein L29 n=1 Tax=Rhabdochlamydiaceae symbiont of Dictyostelium giganteum TaxID=3342349 RepID=UPI00384C564A
MLKMNDLIDQTPAELKALYHTLSKEIYRLKCELKINRKIEKPHLLQGKKKDRARVLTALSQQSGDKV